MQEPADAIARVEAIMAALEDRREDLLTPALVIDLDVVEHNVAAMATLAGPGRWRPHIKTIKQPALVQMLLEAEIPHLKCATLDELALALDAANATGIHADVLLAYPQSTAGARAAARLASMNQNATVRLLADNPNHLAQLDDALADAPTRLSVLLDVDVGMTRTGTPPKRWSDLAAPRYIDLVGLHGYEGHLSWHERDAAYAAYDGLVELAATVPATVQSIVTSGSHAFHHALAHPGLAAGPWTHQVSPGTLVLGDLRTEPAAALLGLEQAAFVLSRVVATPRPGRVTLDAGSKALNPDCPAPACVAVGYPSMHGLPASEEHRPFQIVSQIVGELVGKSPAFGDIVALVPEHVCTTVNLFREVHYTRGTTLLEPGVVAGGLRTTLASRVGS
ncbi:MAG: alanine racemase [Myxococcota bacterium]